LADIGIDHGNRLAVGESIQQSFQQGRLARIGSAEQ
jgi:hypothetical protein